MNASFKKNNHCSLSHTWHNLRAGESELPRKVILLFLFFCFFIGSLIFSSLWYTPLKIRVKKWVLYLVGIHDSLWYHLAQYLKVYPVSCQSLFNAWLRRRVADNKFYFIRKLVAQKSRRKLRERIILALVLTLKQNCQGWNPCLRRAICVRIRSKLCEIVPLPVLIRSALTMLIVVSTSLSGI